MAAGVDAARGRGRWIRLALGTAIAVAFAAAVEWYLGWGRLLQPWRELPVVVVAVPAALFLASHGLRALRVHDFFGDAVRERRLACLQLVLRHNLANNLLPMRAGELAFPVLMARRFGVAAGESIPGLAWFRVLDLHAIGVLALAALAPYAPATAVAGIALAWLALPWLLFRRGRPLAAAVVERAPRRLRRLLERLLAGVPAEASRFWRSWAWTLGTWTLKLASFAWVLLLFAPLTPSAAVFGAVAGELTSVLPVHGIAGVGTYEAGVVAGLAPGGGEPAALVRAAVNLHLFMLGVSVVAGAVAALPWGRARPERPPPHDSGERT